MKQTIKPTAIEKGREIRISSFDGSAFGGMILARLGHPVFERDWNRSGSSKNIKALAEMFLELNKKLPYPFKESEVNFVKELLQSI